MNGTSWASAVKRRAGSSAKFAVQYLIVLICVCVGLAILAAIFAPRNPTTVTCYGSVYSTTCTAQ